MLGQYIREEAPESHAKKGGTPTTGGVFIITSIIIASLIALSLVPEFLPHYENHFLSFSLLILTDKFFFFLPAS